MRVFMDFETRSKANIKAVGGHKYTKNLVSVLCLCYYIEGVTDGVELWTPGDPEPEMLFAAVECGAELHAYNAAFEEAVWSNHCVVEYGFPEVSPEQWHCTAAQSSATALPRALGECGKTLKLSKTKDEEGKLAMMQLCKPRKPTKNNPSIWYTDEDRFEKLYSYCRDDVLSEIAIDKATPTLSDREREVWLLDQRINKRGVPIDIELAAAALSLWKRQQEKLNRKLAEITKGEITSAGQVGRIVDYVNSRGVELKNSQAPTIAEALRRKDLPDDVRTVLRIRKELGLASVDKYKRMIACAEEDGRVRGVHMYHGSTTGRWAGRLVQFQNVARTTFKGWEIEECVGLVYDGDLDAIAWIYPSVGKVLSGLLRPTVCALPGKKLIVCDFAAVEARGVAWLAGQKSLLDLFRNGEPVYETMAGKIYDEDPTELHRAYESGDKAAKQKRHLGKSAVLGCGYQMGWRTFHKTCEKQGLEIDKELAELAVATYREENPRIESLWGSLNDCAIAAVNEPGRAKKTHGIRFLNSKGWLWCWLPSGRRIAYRKPFVKDKALPPPFPPGTKRPAVFFTGISQKTGKAETQSTYGGKLTENIVQAICRDLLAEAMLRLEAKGYPTVMHVHDEVVCEVDEDFGSLAEVIEIMSEVPDWAEGFPVGCDGFEGRRYRK